MKRKLAVSVPEDLAAEAERAVSEGRAPSVSAYVSEALAEKSGREDLDDVLSGWDRELGPPGPEAMAWAEKVWQRMRSLTRARSSGSTALSSAGAARH